MTHCTRQCKNSSKACDFRHSLSDAQSQVRKAQLAECGNNASRLGDKQIMMIINVKKKAPKAGAKKSASKQSRQPVGGKEQKSQGGYPPGDNEKKDDGKAKGDNKGK